MNIENMSDEKKSVILAKLQGWRLERKQSELDRSFGQNVDVWFLYDESGITIGICDDYQDSEEWGNMMIKYNLYDPINMALSWRLLNWSDNNVSIGTKFMIYWNQQDMWTMPPADAQRLWLDKILELAIEAGVVEESE